VEFLESLGATVLLTCGHPLTPGVDRRLDPLIDRASTIISLEHDPEGGHRMHVSRARLVGAPRIPLPFRIGPSGIPDGGKGRVTGAGTSAQLRPLSGRGRLAVIRAGDADLPEDMLALLRRDYDVTIAESLESGSAADGAADAAGVIIAADRNSLASAHDLVRQLAELPRRPPISVILGGHHRSLDRARLLRTGAEDVFAWDLGGQELLQRLAKALARGAGAARGARSGPQFGDPPDLEAFVRPEFRAALTQALATRPPLEHPTTWVAMALTPRPRAAEGAVGRSALVEMLEGVVLTAIRTADGDRAAADDDSVVLYLHEAGVGDAETVAARIRTLWRAGRHGPLRVQLRQHTSAETALVSAAAAARLS